MSNLRNKVNLIGRVGMRPEKKEVGNGYVLTRFSIATNEAVKDKVSGEWKNNTTWHNVLAWGKTAERICLQLDKGSEVAIEGKLVSKTYESKEGTKRTTIDIEISDFVSMGNKVENRK
jgi:single-strand DNA-binding protein